MPMYAKCAHMCRSGQFLDVLFLRPCVMSAENFGSLRGYLVLNRKQRCSMITNHLEKNKQKHGKPCKSSFRKQEIKFYLIGMTAVNADSTREDLTNLDGSCPLEPDSLQGSLFPSFLPDQSYVYNEVWSISHRIHRTQVGKP